MDLDDEELEATRERNKTKREDIVYATKFAFMQQQIDKKDERIKELQEENDKLKQTILNMTETMFARDAALTKTIREIEKVLKDINNGFREFKNCNNYIYPLDYVQYRTIKEYIQQLEVEKHILVNK